MVNLQVKVQTKNAPKDWKAKVTRIPHRKESRALNVKGKAVAIVDLERGEISVVSSYSTVRVWMQGVKAAGTANEQKYSVLRMTTGNSFEFLGLLKDGYETHLYVSFSYLAAEGTEEVASFEFKLVA